MDGGPTFPVLWQCKRNPCHCLKQKKTPKKFHSQKLHWEDKQEQSFKTQCDIRAKHVGKSAPVGCSAGSALSYTEHILYWAVYTEPSCDQQNFWVLCTYRPTCTRLTACLVGAAMGPCWPQVPQPAAALGPPPGTPCSHQTAPHLSDERISPLLLSEELPALFPATGGLSTRFLPISFFVSCAPPSAHKGGSLSASDGLSPFVLLICTPTLSQYQQQLKEKL